VANQDKEELEEEIAEKKKEIAKKKAAKSGESTLDPMLVDPVAAQQEKFSGTTSDAATRVEGTTYEDVPSDPDSGSGKSTDDEDYAFPPAGDVDIATVEAGPGEGEVMATLTVEDWVVLDGSHEQVPDSLDGRRAAVINIHPIQEYYTQEEIDEVTLTVRTRDDYAATLAIPFAAVKEVQRRGVNPVRG
jgi:hypothetical protein